MSSSPAGWASIPRWVLYDTDLSEHAKMLLLCLSSFLGAAQSAWPSVATLAKMSGMSESTVKRTLNDLRERGLVEWSGQVRADGGQSSNLYRLDLNPPGQGDTPPRSEGPTPSVTVTDERTSVNVPHENEPPPQQIGGAAVADTVSDQPPDWVKKIDWMSPEKWTMVLTFAQHTDPVAAVGGYCAWSEEHSVEQSFSRYWQWLAKAEAAGKSAKNDEDVNVRAMRAIRASQQQGVGA